ncbi:replication initiation protein, RepL2 [Streptomyces sp. NPDC050145]|uniref:replication initiation protein, RepL2 n=1 Tax=Streptomyces sp. NPDC050145 TaxID=3365602 RepID=UPI0037874D68
MKIQGPEDVVDVLRRTGRVLSPNQRLVVLLYASVKQEPDGSVVVRASELAEIVGMNAPSFSRTRKELVALGWLEEAGRVGQVKLYRLAEQEDEPQARGREHLRVVG